MSAVPALSRGIKPLVLITIFVWCCIYTYDIIYKYTQMYSSNET